MVFLILGVLSGWVVLAIALGLTAARAITLGQRAPRPRPTAVPAPRHSLAA